MSGPTRNVYWTVVKNFIDSFKPRRIRGNDMGKDYIGNSYFEIPAEPSAGKRKPTRWYNPPKGQDFQDPIPAEWEAWLRMRRQDPPTEEEIAKNLAIAQMKKINAAKIEAKRLAEGGSLPTVPEKGHHSFPVYPDYHPGEPQNELPSK